MLLFAVVVEGCVQMAAHGHIDIHESASFMDGLDVLLAYGALQLNLLPVLIVGLEGHTTPGAGDHVASFWIEIDGQFLVQYAVEVGFGTADDNFVCIAARCFWTFIDRKDPGVDRAILAEEIMCHAEGVEHLFVLGPVGVMSDIKVEHPSCIGPHLEKTRIKTVFQFKVAATKTVRTDDQGLSLHQQTVGIHQFHIQDTAHVGVRQVTGFHNVCLVPYRVALEIAVVVEMQIDFLLNRSFLQDVADIVETDLRFNSAKPANEHGKKTSNPFHHVFLFLAAKLRKKAETSCFFVRKMMFQS